jgi:predicted RNA-binding Zn-ribbon protein involved in translation (DUF1610 family)
MLTLVKHRLPPLWDGVKVTWRPFKTADNYHVCPPPKKAERCPCGSTTPPLIASGLRERDGVELVTRPRKLKKSGRVIDVREEVPAWPVYDLTAFRCPECGQDEVWDQRTDEWWTLDENDYGPTGSDRPYEREWTGGLFDLLPDPTWPDSEKSNT